MSPGWKLIFYLLYHEFRLGDKTGFHHQKLSAIANEFSSITNFTLCSSYACTNLNKKECHLHLAYSLILKVHSIEASRNQTVRTVRWQVKPESVIASLLNDWCRAAGVSQWPAWASVITLPWQSVAEHWCRPGWTSSGRERPSLTDAQFIFICPVRCFKL